MDTSKADDEKKFNDTLKRMLQTAPKQHDTGKVDKSPKEKAKARPAKASPSSSSKQ
ncbi:hypothetical protein [Mesorhizobium cantuariense]|uniref:Uncharacterized protein n=1 Tax=Mesorhizobium cantuariense TaxID=1300275 RepID=A0ABV7MST6_9HYPH